MPTIRLTRLGAFYLTLCALVLAAALWPQPARAQAVNADLSITADADAVNAGDAVLFTVTLKNTGDQPATNLVLDLTLAGPVDTVRARLDEEATTGVNTAGIRRSSAGLRWRGGIAAQAQLVINLRVTSSLVGEDDVITLTGAAGRFDAEPVLNASKSVDVKAYDLNPNDLSLTKSLLHGYGTVAGVTAGERVEVLPREEVGIQLELTNNSDVTVYTLLVDEMAQQAVAAARADADRVTCKLEPIAATVETGRGFRVPVDALGEPLPDGFKYGFLV